MITGLTEDQFAKWLDTYGNASENNDPNASAGLFAQNALYYESPFDAPIIGRAAIFQYWVNGTQKLKDKTTSYEIIAVKDNLGVARWQAKFTVIETGNRLALDCLFLVEFNDEGLCQNFREWWHIQAIAPDATSIR